jgi:hypothetical protein
MRSPSEEAIRELIDKLRSSFPLTDDEYTQLIKRLHARLSIKMEQGAKLVAEYRPWLAARRADINPFFWTRYRDFLLKKGWASPVVATLGQITDDNPITKVRTSAKRLRETDVLTPAEFAALLPELKLRDRRRW